MFSRRSIQLLQSSKYYSNQNVLENNLAFNLEINDEKLLLSYLKSENELIGLFREVLSIFLNGRLIDRLHEVSLREILNFLRDDHEDYILNSDNQELFQRTLDQVKSEIFEAYLWKMSNDFSSFDNSTYLGKNHFISNLFSKIFLKLGLKEQFRFYYFNHEYVYYFAKGTSQVNYLILSLERFLSNYYKERIKLVAVKV